MILVTDITHQRLWGAAVAYKNPNHPLIDRAPLEHTRRALDLTQFQMARLGTNMATWGTYEAGLKRIPPEQAVRAMNRLVAPPELAGPSLWWGWSAMPTILGRPG